jgi:hypothetical protein
MRFYFWILGVFTVGRWGLSLGGAKYADTHHVFSLVILALIASAHHAAFARAFAGYGLGQAVKLGAMIGLVTQLVVFGSTALSYMLGLETFFNTPFAIARNNDPIGFGSAMGQRAVGVVVNTILNMIAASLGYAMGGGLPKKA